MVVKKMCPGKVSLNTAMNRAGRGWFFNTGRIGNEYCIFMSRTQIMYSFGRVRIEEDVNIPLVKADMDMKLKGIPFRRKDRGYRNSSFRITNDIEASRQASLYEVIQL